MQTISGRSCHIICQPIVYSAPRGPPDTHAELTRSLLRGRVCVSTSQAGLPVILSVRVSCSCRVVFPPPDVRALGGGRRDAKRLIVRAIFRAAGSCGVYPQIHRHFVLASVDACRDGVMMRECGGGRRRWRRIQQ